MNTEYESPRGDSKPMPDRGVKSGVDNTALGDASESDLNNGFYGRGGISKDTKSDPMDFA